MAGLFTGSMSGNLTRDAIAFENREDATRSTMVFTVAIGQWVPKEEKEVPEFFEVVFFGTTKQVEMYMKQAKKGKPCTVNFNWCEKKTSKSDDGKTYTNIQFRASGVKFFDHPSRDDGDGDDEPRQNRPSERRRSSAEDQPEEKPTRKPITSPDDIPF